MTRLLSALAVFAVVGVSGCRERPPAACTLLSTEEIAGALGATGVRTDSGSGFDSSTGIDRCRWTADGGAILELRLYRAGSSADGAWEMVFDSAKAYATRPDASGQIRARSLSGVGDDAMFLPGSGGESSVAFRVGSSGAVLAGRLPEGPLVTLASRVAGRL